MTNGKKRSTASDDPLKNATLAALKRLLEPIVALMLDTGITVQDLNRSVRESAVRVATKRIVEKTGRESRSRVAIMTGLPRSEITKILRENDSPAKDKPDQHPARRVLAGWYDSPQFADPNGEPATLPIFGKVRSFQSLVQRFGGGIPVRAMLDELTQMDAVERLEEQKVRAKTRMPILTGLTQLSIAAVGERGKDLLETLTRNIRQGDEPFFEATAVIENSDPERVSLLRREIAQQGSNFINSTTSFINRSRKKVLKSSHSSEHVRLGVTVFYFQDHDSETPPSNERPSRVLRKNLKRKKVALDKQFSPKPRS